MAPLVGRRVIVDGLSSKPELNGSRGIAVGFDEDKGRYTVRLDAGEGGFGDIEFAAYDKGWNDALEKRKYAPLAMAGTLIYQMGAPGGQPWSAANAIAGARNMNPMTLVFLLNMLSGLF
ncbi:hypothetical protein EMIHUDRAFT_227184 [Emiliania huxleyi CCMP1516]|uniref:Uncharacterized protein n=2 Tax=Emiliania huxleyi TaxID=2903 RepID=A0A0D3KJD0_EMIH1|nr:hypothetical protein EMIHUDRAFT_227184 [Emiliania huxleyi CCMP1516]EOD35865.1 hypothetical protein EMIHUDRAFT_227184 [Emiliania huxleyi CCMP1516]|eukprot:XP_005788294.1 hypothetical protein EMIHUDRAFT_227184 [Emiliania huxleyi CCMP1516]